MPDENMNTQTGQSGDLGTAAVQQNVNEQSQARVNAQSPDVNWDERERALLARAYQQAQSLVSKSENRQSANLQSTIDQFKRDYGVTLTPEQAQEMAQNQAAKSMQNAPQSAQTPAQNAPAIEPSYQGFMYYHGINEDSPVFRQAFQIQQTLGVELDKNDEEYKAMLDRDTKYQPAEFVEAWKNACVAKLMRLRSTQNTEQGQQNENTNLGQMPLIGSKGAKSNPYDPARTAKSYFQEYYKDMKK